VKSAPNTKDGPHYLTMEGLPAALSNFLASGAWPNWRTGASSATVTRRDIHRFSAVLDSLTATRSVAEQDSHITLPLAGRGVLRQ
jgi:hypothetical protein